MSAKKEETFLIRIQDCQNATWQGSILWAERQQKINFRSTLEMISLIEEALQLDRKDEGQKEVDMEARLQSKKPSG